MAPGPTKRTTPKKTDAEKQAQRRAEAIAALEESDALSFKIRGKQYTVRLDEVSASISRRFRQATGMTVSSVVQLVGTAPDPDVWQCMAFLAELQAGADVTLDDIEDFTFADILTLDVVETVEDPESPER